MLNIYDVTVDIFEGNIRYTSEYIDRHLNSAKYYLENELGTIDKVSPEMDSFSLYRNGFELRTFKFYRNADLYDLKNFTGFIIPSEEDNPLNHCSAMDIRGITEACEEAQASGHIGVYMDGHVWWRSPSQNPEKWGDGYNA